MNQRVGSIDNILRRAVVTLQLKESSLRIDLSEVENITDIRSAERVDTLGIVAHHTDIILGFRQAFHKQELDIIRILILVHQDVLELLLILLAHLGMSVHQPQHIDEQIIKIHRIRCFESGLVKLVDRCDLIQTHLAIFPQQLLVHAILSRTDTAILSHRDTT